MKNATQLWRNGLLSLVFIWSFTGPVQAQVTNTVTFNNAIVIPGEANTGNYYPANLVVSGQQALVSKVVVTLTNVNWSAQCVAAVYIMSPSGQTISLYGRNGDCSSFLGTLVFDQASANTFPAIYTSSITPGTYQPISGGGVNLPPGTTANLNDLNGTAANGTWKLYMELAVARDDYTATLPSWSLTITTIPDIANNIIAAPATSSFCATGDAANIVGSTPIGGIGTYAYQWQKSTDNINFSNVATTISYDPSSASQTIYYRRIVTSSVATDTSNTVTIAVHPTVGNNTLTAPAIAAFYAATGNATSITGSTPTGGSGGYNYQWQKSSNNVSFTDIPGAAGLGKNYDPPSISTTTYYRRLVNSGACTTDDVSAATAISILYSSWTGGLNTDWANTANWSNGIPLTTYKVNIPAVSNTIVLTSPVTITELAMDNTILTLNSNLSLTGNLTQTGGTIDGSAALELTGSTQTLAGTGTIKNLTLNSSGTATISGTVSINGILTPTAGVLATGGNLTLLKDGLSANGRIAAGSIAGGYITGNVNVQCYISGGFRKYRLLGHPFSTAVNLFSIADDIDITGSITGSNANGFAATTNNAPSAFSFSEPLDDGLTGTGSNAGWQAYTSGNNTSTIAAGQGIRVLVRGSKAQAGSLTGGTYTPNPVTIAMAGPLRQGNFLQILSFTDVSKGWNLVSNPYASNIDWATVAKTNVGAAVYTYRPSLSAGTYASYNNGSSTNGGSQYLEMGTAFFVRSTAASPSLTWHETDKSATAPASTVLRTFNTIHNRISLLLANEQTSLTDEVVIRFGDDPATDIFDNEYDAYNLPGAAHDIYVMDELQNRYSIYHGSALKAANTEKRELALGMDNLLPGNYTITAKTLNAFVDGNTAYLKDAELNAFTEITDDISYPFSIAANQTTSSRFSIVFNAKRKLVQAGFAVTVSPNPASSSINIAYQGLNKKEVTTIIITDMNGKLLKTIDAGSVEAGQQQININRWSKGIYTVQLLNGNNRQSQTFIKQ